MIQYVDVARITGAPERKRDHGALSVRLLIAAAAIISVGAVVCNASLTSDERNEAYLQSGMSP